MKNININKIESKSYIAEVEFHILNGGSQKTLDSLNNPESVSDAINVVKDLIKKNNKYKNIIPLDNDKLLAKIIFLALENNKTIQDQLSIFSQQISSKIANTRVEVGFLVADYANNSYKPNSGKKVV